MYGDVLNAERWLTFADPIDSIAAYMTNAVLNAVDVHIELNTLYNAAVRGDYARVGRYMAKVTADLLAKSPIRDSWSYQNSESVKYKMRPKNDIIGMVIRSLGSPPKESVIVKLSECVKGHKGNRELVKRVEEVLESEDWLKGSDILAQYCI